VVWDVNHPTNYDAWMYRKATQGWGADSIRILKTKMFSSSVTEAERKAGTIASDPQSEDEIIAALLALVDERTKLVTLSWQSNECGMVLPMQRIVSELRAVNKNIHIHADSAQTFGVLDLKLGQVDVDSIAGSFHKWPCGPRMVGVIYMNPATGAAERFAPGTWGYDEHINTPAHYGFAPETGGIDATARRFSYLGQQNDVTLVAAWMTALFHTGHFHPGVTPPRVEARTHALGTRLKNALYRHLPRMFPDFREDAAWRHIVTPTTNDALRSAVYLFRTPEGVAAGDVMQHVYAKHRFAIAYLRVMGQDLLRISPSICNLADDVEGVVAAIADVVEALRAGRLPSSPPSRAYI
jgi:selenocysteine lyase/cysteine desulfurase